MWIKWGSLLLAIFAIILCIYLFITKKEIAYVRSAKIIEEYKGMKEIMKLIDQKTEYYQFNIDSLSSSILNDEKKISTNREKLSKKELLKSISNLTERKQILSNYQQEVSNNLEEYKEKMLQSGLNQINSFVEKYAMQHQIDLVLGVTASGNIMYGKDNLDITDLIIVELNNQYEGK